MSQETIINNLQILVTAVSQQAFNHKIQSKVFASQTFTKLADKYAAHYEEEMGFVDQFIDRLLDLGADVKNEDKKAMAVISDPVAYIKADLEDSIQGLPVLHQMVQAAKDDITTYDMLKDYYKDEEEDLYWSENELDLIEKIGVQNWLTKQL